MLLCLEKRESVFSKSDFMKIFNLFSAENNSLFFKKLSIKQPISGSRLEDFFQGQFEVQQDWIPFSPRCPEGSLILPP